MIRLEFVHVPEDRMWLAGEFPFVQITYADVRVGEEGERFVASFENGLWVTEDGQIWTDVIIG